METPPTSPGGRRIPIFVLSVLLVAAVVVVFGRGGLPLLPSRAVLSRVQLGGAACFVFGMTVHLGIRYVRTWFLIAPIAKVPLRRLFSINAVGMAFITYLPFRLGEVSRPAMLRERGRLSAWAVTGTVAVERLFDGLMYSTMLLLGLALAPPRGVAPFPVGSVTLSPSLVPGVARLAAIAFTGACLLVTAVHFSRGGVRRAVERALSVVSPAFAVRVASGIERLADGLGLLTDARFFVPYLGLTVLAGSCHVVALEFLATSVGLPPLSFAEGMVVVGVLALGFAPLNAPGFFGAVQLALYAGLSIYVDPARVLVEGSAFVFVFYVTYLGSITALAGVGLVLESFASGRPSY